MIEYTLHFELKKHKQAKHFNTTVRAKDTDDIQGIKEERAMFFEEFYHTPVRCVKVDKKVVTA